MLSPFRISAAFALALFSILASPAIAGEGKPQPAMQSAETQAERLALANELLVLSNVPEGVELWKAGLLKSANFDQCGCASAKGMVEKLKDGWTRAVSEEFKPADVVANLAKATAQEFSVADLKALIAVRRSPIGRKVSAAQRAGQTRGQEEDAAAGMKRLALIARRLEANKTRKALIEKIAAEQGGARAYADVYINISIGSSIGASAAAPDNAPKFSHEEIVAQIEAMRPMMEKQFGAIVVPALASQYESLSDRDLKEFLAASRTKLERRMTALELAAFNAAMRAEAMKIGARLAQEIQGEKI